MCLKVFANGDNDGENTHISVFVQLMAGEYDDQLQWPFVGDIEFMLLNWREDKGHLHRRLWKDLGFSQINASYNCEYLQNVRSTLGNVYSHATRW